MSPSTSNALVVGLLSGAAITLLVTGFFSYLKPEKNVDLEEEVEEKELQADFVDGVAGLIGNTPLMKIKSLSEATGCLILVCNYFYFFY